MAKTVLCFFGRAGFGASANTQYIGHTTANTTSSNGATRMNDAAPTKYKGAGQNGFYDYSKSKGSWTTPIAKEYKITKVIGENSQAMS